MGSFEIFYKAAAQSPANLPPHLEEAMVRWALAHKDSSYSSDVLVSLCRRESILDSTDKALSKVQVASVKAAWLSRPGRSAELLSSLLGKEKRATVLVSIAQSANASEDVLAALAGDSRPSVVWAVLSSPNASSAVKAKALVNASCASQAFKNYDNIQLFRRLVAELPSSHEMIALKSSEPLALKLLLSSSSLSPAAQSALAQKLVIDRIDSALEHVNRYYYYSAGTPEEVFADGSRVLDFTGLPDEVRTKVANELTRLYQAICVKTQPYGPRSSVFSDEVLTKIKLFAGDDSERKKAAQEAEAQAARLALAAVGSAEEVEPIALALITSLEKDSRRVYSDRSTLLPLTSALLSNPSLPPELLLRLVKLHSPRAISLDALFKTFIPRHASGVALNLAARLCFSYSTVLPSNLPSLVDDFEGVVKEYLSLYELSQPGHERTLEIFMGTSALINERTVCMVPSAAVLAHPVALSMNLISDALGSDPAAWQTFEVLASSFTGSFGDLLAAAKALS